MNDRHLPANERSGPPSDLQHALWTALVVTAVIIVALKSMTGIAFLSAILVAVVVFAITFGWILRTKRGVRR